MPKLSEYLFGMPEKRETYSLLNQGQQGLQNNQFAALNQRGVGGAYGGVADQYRSMMSGGEDDSFINPLMQEYNQETIPGLAEQFAGMGSGGMSSSGFRNAGLRAGADLQERIGALRAQLRMQGAQGMQGLAQQAMQPSQGFLMSPRVPGVLEQFSGAFGGAAAQGIGRKLGGFV
jgi:hypothetical protein